MAIALVQSKLGSYAASAADAGIATTGSIGFTSTTIGGSLLICVCTSFADDTFQLGQGPPTINTPVTSGLTWILAGTCSVLDPADEYSCRTSVFYVENAPSIATSATTQVVATVPAEDVTIEFALYEFSGVVTSSSLETMQTVDHAGGALEHPHTANLVTSNTSNSDLIFVTYGIGGDPIAAGSGYTLGVDLTGNGDAAQSQYILNQPAGIIATAFGENIVGGAPTYYGAVSLAFKAIPDGPPSPSAKLLAFYRLDGLAGHDAEVPSGLINSGNVTFSLIFAPNPTASLFLYKNGNFMVQGIDYTLSTSAGSAIGVLHMTTPPNGGDTLIAWYRSDTSTLGIADNEIPLGVIDGTNPDFTLTHNVLTGTLVLFQRKADGSSSLSLTPNGFDYTVSGNLIIMMVPPAAGDTLRAFYRYTPLV